uniref:Uncharacterized protein n=1 Tax=Anguilla anguilla TaxID=7936 RepID=A0A0E9RVG6_ANGAN
MSNIMLTWTKCACDETEQWKSTSRIMVIT